MVSPEHERRRHAPCKNRKGRAAFRALCSGTEKQKQKIVVVRSVVLVRNGFFRH